MRNFIKFDPSHIFIAATVSFIILDILSLFTGNKISLGMMLLQFVIPTALALVVYMCQTYYRKKHIVKK
jgi:hypothetical protein